MRQEAGTRYCQVPLVVTTSGGFLRQRYLSRKPTQTGRLGYPSLYPSFALVFCWSYRVQRPTSNSVAKEHVVRADQVDGDLKFLFQGSGKVNKELSANVGAGICCGGVSAMVNIGNAIGHH